MPYIKTGKPRGFAAMDKDLQRELASKGGKAAWKSGKAHRLSSEEAKAAGRKGGLAVSQDRDHMVEIARKGGQNSHGGGRPRKVQDIEAESTDNE
jgi:hypothetical protein